MGERKILTQLLMAGAHVDARPEGMDLQRDDGCTPLMLAAERGHAECVQVRGWRGRVEEKDWGTRFALSEERGEGECEIRLGGRVCVGWKMGSCAGREMKGE